MHIKKYSNLTQGHSNIVMDVFYIAALVLFSIRKARLCTGAECICLTLLLTRLTNI